MFQAYHGVTGAQHQVTGMTYFDYVKTRLLRPAAISEVEVFPTLAFQRTQSQAICGCSGDGGAVFLVPGAGVEPPHAPCGTQDIKPA